MHCCPLIPISFQICRSLTLFVSHLRDPKVATPMLLYHSLLVQGINSTYLHVHIHDSAFEL